MVGSRYASKYASGYKMIDIFIVNFFCASDTAQAIRSIGDYPQWKFWVIDNSDNQEAWNELTKELSAIAFPIELIRAPKNLGFGNACNVLFSKSNSAFCLLLNPDAQITPTALLSLIDTLEVTPDYGALAPLMRWYENEEWWIPSMTPQTSFYQIWQSIIQGNTWLLQKTWKRYYKKQQAIVTSKGIISQSFLSGAILLLRRSAINLASPLKNEIFDRRFFMFFEDADLSRRLISSGFKLGINPSSLGMHLYQHKTSKSQLMQESYALYEAMHQPWYTKLKPYWLHLFNSIQSKNSQHPPIIRASNLEQFNQALGNKKLIAWSPSPTVIPAIWRKLSPDSTVSFTQNSWEALIPGRYYGVAINQDSQFTWIEFERL